MPNRTATSSGCELRPAPSPIDVSGKTLFPVAVAMYGRLDEVVPFSSIVDEDGEIFAGHTVLFAERTAER